MGLPCSYRGTHMKTLLIIGIASICVSPVEAGFVTLVVPNGTNMISEIQLKPYEAAELVSFPSDFGSPQYGTRIEVVKEGLSFRYSPQTWAVTPYSTVIPKPPLEPLVVTGPAVIQFVTTDTRGKAMCTFKITPEAYPPDKSAIVMPGTNGGARVTLEASTDLTTWAPATNGVYTNLPSAKFFRIAVERVQ